MIVRIVSGVLAALLFVWMIVLLFRGPSFTVENDSGRTLDVGCASAIDVGWPSDSAELQGKTTFDSVSLHIGNVEGLTSIQLQGLLQECNERRDTYLGIMAILAAPTAVLAAVAIFWRGRNRRPADA